MQRAWDILGTGTGRSRQTLSSGPRRSTMTQRIKWNAYFTKVIDNGCVPVGTESLKVNSPSALIPKMPIVFDP